MTISRRSFLKDAGALAGLSLKVPELSGNAAHRMDSGPSSSAETATASVPRVAVKNFAEKFYPAYLSNGLIGIRPGPNPLVPAQATVNGFVYTDIPDRVVSLSPSPYPLVTDIRVHSVRLLKHPECVKVEQQTLDMASGELLTEMVSTPPGGTPLRLTVLQFACRAVPSLLCQQISISTSAGTTVEVYAASTPRTSQVPCSVPARRSARKLI